MNEESVRDYESEATEQGWNPDFDGPNKTDAKTFVERGEQIAGILKNKNAKLEGRIHNLEDSNRKFGEYHKKTLEAQQKKDAAQIQELEGQLAQAITDGDGQAYTKYNREIDYLKSEQQVPTDDAQLWAQMSQAWVNENQWYQSNHKLAKYADGVSDEIRSEGYNGQAYFSELTRRVKEDFPEEFKNPNKSRANVTEEVGQRSTTNSKERTFENLDAESKRACNDFVKQGFMTKEDYLANYEWDE